MEMFALNNTTMYKKNTFPPADGIKKQIES